MVFINNNFLTSDIFNPVFIPCFSGSIFFRVQVFLGIWVQGLGPGFTSSQTLRVNNSRIFEIKKAKFPWYYYMNTSVYGDNQICISVPLKKPLMRENNFCEIRRKNFQKLELIRKWFPNLIFFRI